MPSYVSPSDFWNLSLHELILISENVRQVSWEKQYSDLRLAQIHAHYISKILAGKPLPPIESYISPNPRKSRTRSMEEIEMTLLQWSNQD